MGQKYCKKLNIEITHKFHAEIKEWARRRNMTIRRYVMRSVRREINKDEKTYK